MIPLYSLENLKINKSFKKYIELEIPPYILQIDGPWGIGKTHLVFDLMDQFRNYKFLYVSASGLKEVSQIEKQILVSMDGGYNKFLNSITEIAFEVVKQKIFLDLSKLKKKENKIFNFVKPNLPEYLKEHKKDNILIIDDIERFEGSISSLLGFAARVFEQSENKIILVGNFKILETHKDCESYNLELVNKIIGKRIEIDLNFNSAFKRFTLALKAQEKELQELKSLIQEVFIASGYQNLRGLRTALHFISDFFTQISEDDEFCNYINSKKALRESLVRDLTIQSLEYCQKGTQSAFIIHDIHFDNLENEKSESSSYLNFGNDTTKSKSDQEEKVELTNSIRRNRNDILKKYNYTFGQELIFKTSYFRKLSKGSNSFWSKLKKEVLSNPDFFEEEKEVAWTKLWRFRSLSDEKFALYSNQLIKDFKQGLSSDLYNFLHTVGLLIKLEKLELLESQLDLSLKNIVDHFEQLTLKNNFKATEVDQNDFEDSSYGYQYHSHKDELFKQVRSKVIEKNNDLYSKILQQDLNKQLNLALESANIDKITPLLRYIDQKSPHNFYQLKTLSSMNSETYELISKLPTEVLSEFLRLVWIRIDDSSKATFLEERKYVEELIKKLKESTHSKELSKLRAYLISDFIKDCEKIYTAHDQALNEEKAK